jgi:putative ABC transport system ATP-binding protein
MNVMIRATDVTKTYGKGALATPVLHGVSLEVRAGELVLLTGPSGSGKTTLLSILGGLLQPSGGRVELCGAALTGMKDTDVSKMRRNHLGFVFQTYNLFPALTALDNVAQALKLKAPDAPRSRAREALEQVGLGERAGHRPGELSGGQKQRVAIARAIAPEPDVIIGAEVTSALDGTTAMEVMGLLRGWLGPRRAVLLVTHDHRMERFADRIVEMEDGRVVNARAGGNA